MESQVIIYAVWLSTTQVGRLCVIAGFCGIRRELSLLAQYDSVSLRVLMCTRFQLENSLFELFQSFRSFVFAFKIFWKFYRIVE